MIDTSCSNLLTDSLCSYWFTYLWCMLLINSKMIILLVSVKKTARVSIKICRHTDKIYSLLQIASGQADICVEDFQLFGSWSLRAIVTIALSVVECIHFYMDI